MDRLRGYINRAQARLTQLTPASASQYTTLVLVFILAIAFILRVWGVNFGLPYTQHADEGAIVMPALKILQTGDFNPHRFDYGSVHIYLLVAVYALYFLYGAHAGVLVRVQDIPVIDDYHAIGIYPFPAVFLVGRLLSVVGGVLAVYWIYRIGARVWSRNVGLLAAAFLAVLPVHVRHSHFIISDPLMIWLLLVALELIIRAYENGRIRQFLVAGTLAGLAASTKQSAVQIAPALALAAIGSAHTRGKRWLALLAGYGALAVSYLIGTPYALLDLPEFLNWQAYQLRAYAPLGSSPIFEGPSWQWHWHYMLTSENALLFVLALAGILLTLKKRWVGLIVITFPVLHWWSMSGQELRFLRTWLPAAPFACLFAAVTIVALAEWLSRRTTWLNGRVGRIAAVLSLVVISPLLVESIAVDSRLTQPDVRDHAIAWSEENLPSGTNVAIDLFGPALSPERWNLTRVLDISDYTLDWYRTKQIDYLMLSEIMSADFNRTVLSEQRLQLLRDACRPLKEFSGPVLGRPPTHIWIYELAQCQEN